MSETSERRRIAVVGFFGAGNAGDDAIGTAVCETLADAADVHISRKGIDPFTGHDVHPFRLTLGNLFTEIRRADTVVITGGTHFHDVDDDRRRILKKFFGFLSLVMMARLSLSDVFLIGHGVGPIERRWTELVLRLLLLFVDGISVRDPDAANLLAERLNHDCVLAFDLAATLDVADEPTRGCHDSDDGAVIGVSVTPVDQVYSDRPCEDRERIERIASTLDSVTNGSDVSRIHIYAFHTGSEDADLALSEALSEALGVESEIIAYRNDPEALFRQVGRADYFVGMRYHSIVYGYLNELPMVTIPYHDKCRYFSKYVGYNRAGVVDPLVAPDQFETQVRQLVKSPSDYAASMDKAEARRLAERNFQFFSHRDKSRGETPRRA